MKREAVDVTYRTVGKGGIERRRTSKGIVSDLRVCHCGIRLKAKQKKYCSQQCTATGRWNR